MKKLLMSSVVLLFFSASMLLFQISCTDDAMANPDSMENDNMIALLVDDGIDGKFMIMDADGSNQNTFNVNLPSGWELDETIFSLSSDNSKILFNALETAGNGNRIYTVDIDGSNLNIVIDNSSSSIVDFAAGAIN